jgi:hypothetical protein
MSKDDNKKRLSNYAATGLHKDLDTDQSIKQKTNELIHNLYQDEIEMPKGKEISEKNIEKVRDLTTKLKSIKP